MAYKEDMAGIPVVGQVPISNPGNASKVVIFNGNLYIWNGITWNSTDASNTSYILKIYRDIVSDISNSELIPGATYVITDYQTVHFFLDGDSTILSDVNIGPIEPIVVTATSENTISSIAYSLVHPQDILHYDWNPDNWLGNKSFSDIDATYDIETSSIVDGFKGVITYREDTIKKNITGFDFKNVKNRRWAIDITTMTWSSAITYAKGAYVSDGVNKVYKSKKEGNNNHVVTDAEWWQMAIDCTQDVYWSWSESDFFGMDINASDYVDRYTFDADKDRENKFANNFIGPKHSFFDDPEFVALIPNIVYYIINNGYDNQCTDNHINGGSYFGNSTFIGNSFQSNKIGNNLNFNIIVDNFNDNLIGDNLVYNMIWGDFNANIIGNDFGYNTVGNGFNNNTIGNIFGSNVIDELFQSNMIGNSFKLNIIANTFSLNTIGNTFQSNTIGDSFSSNTIGNNFDSNIIGNYFQINKIGNYFGNNTIGNNFDSNIIGNVSSSNAIGNNSQSNTIGNNFVYNTIGNYFGGNIIGNIFNFNTIGETFNSNIIGAFFFYNTIGHYFQSNTIGNNFGINPISYNNIGDYFMYNTIGNKVTNLVTPNKANESTGFTYNTIKDNVNFNGVNLSAATLVFSNYNTEISTRADGALRLKYINNSNTEVITTVNS